MDDEEEKKINEQSSPLDKKEDEESSFAKAQEDKEEKNEGEGSDAAAGEPRQSRDSKTEKEDEGKEDKDDFDELTEDQTEPFYKPEERTQNYYEQMKSEEEQEHIPSLGSMSSHVSSSSIYANQQRPQKGNKFHVLILIVIGLLVISGTVYFLKNSFNVGFPSLPFMSEETPSPTPTPTPATPEPTPTPSPLERKDFTLSILNGTSTTGLAASTSSNLKDLGYEVVRVGNATNSAFETTIVRVKPAALSLAEQIIRDLAPQFSAMADLTLPETDSNDSVIILGTK